MGRKWCRLTVCFNSCVSISKIDCILRSFIYCNILIYYLNKLNDLIFGEFEICHLRLVNGQRDSFVRITSMDIGTSLEYLRKLLKEWQKSTTCVLLLKLESLLIASEKIIWLLWWMGDSIKSKNKKSQLND